VRGDAVGLHREHPQLVAAPRDVIGDVEQLVHGQRIGGLIMNAAYVVHPGEEGRALRPGAVLGVLLDAGMQESDARTTAHHVLAVHLEHQTHHAVGRGVLRAEIDHDDLVGAFALGFDDLVPVGTRGQVGLIGDRLARYRENVLRAGNARTPLRLFAHAW